MIELAAHIRRRTREALASLHQAQAEDDIHLTSVRLGELDSLARTAAEHDVDVPELAPYYPGSRLGAIA